MIKRLVAAPLWFISMGWAYALAGLLPGTARGRRRIVGALAAAFVVHGPDWRLLGNEDASIVGQQAQSTQRDRLDALARTPALARPVSRSPFRV